MVVGIDFGAKLSGNTVVCYRESIEEVHFIRAQKGVDADDFLLGTLAELKPPEAFIDAPLSLPGIYSGIIDCHDFFYRKADRITRAMSPMFLGGLTARAIRLKHLVYRNSIILFETYPGYLARHWKLDQSGYKKTKQSIVKVLKRMEEKMPFATSDVRSWHDVDALLAMLSHVRHREGECLKFGMEGEGVIFV